MEQINNIKSQSNQKIEILQDIEMERFINQTAEDFLQSKELSICQHRPCFSPPPVCRIVQCRIGR
jgi:hypothetical protein